MIPHGKNSEVFAEWKRSTKENVRDGGGFGSHWEVRVRDSESVVVSRFLFSCLRSGHGNY